MGHRLDLTFLLVFFLFSETQFTSKVFIGFCFISYVSFWIWYRPNRHRLTLGVRKWVLFRWPYLINVYRGENGISFHFRFEVFDTYTIRSCNNTFRVITSKPFISAFIPIFVFESNITITSLHHVLVFYLLSIKSQFSWTPFGTDN